MAHLGAALGRLELRTLLLATTATSMGAKPTSSEPGLRAKSSRPVWTATRTPSTPPSGRPPPAARIAAAPCGPGRWTAAGGPGTTPRGPAGAPAAGTAGRPPEPAGTSTGGATRGAGTVVPR